MRGRHVNGRVARAPTSRGLREAWPVFRDIDFGGAESCAMRLGAAFALYLTIAKSRNFKTYSAARSLSTPASPAPYTAAALVEAFRVKQGRDACTSGCAEATCVTVPCPAASANASNQSL